MPKSIAARCGSSASQHSCVRVRYCTAERRQIRFVGGVVEMAGLYRVQSFCT